MMTLTNPPVEPEPLDRAFRGDDGITMWRQIADWLDAEIVSGRLEHGRRIPGEHELAARFGVNRHTVRRAIAALAERGVLRATRGSGTYVEAKPLAYPITHRTRFSEIVARQQRQPGGTLVTSLVEAGDDVTCAALALPRHAPVRRIVSVRSADGVPLCLSNSWVPDERVPDFDLVFAATQSITRAFTTFGIADYRRVSTHATASVADEDDARHLDLAVGRPILVLESVNADVTGRPIQRTVARFAGDRVRVEFR